MAPMAVMVFSDLTHWILHKICSSDGPWAGTYFYVLIELLVGGATPNLSITARRNSTSILPHTYL
jgi:hypothetical protein